MTENVSSPRPARVTLYDYAYETFAIQYLASSLKRDGVPTQIYYDCSMNKDYLGQDFFLVSILSLSPRQAAMGILKTDPQVVGFSVLTVYYPEIRKIISELRKLKPDVVVVCGGPHCILAPKHVLENPEVDFVVVGDGEKALADLARKLGSMDLRAVKALPAQQMPGVHNMLDGKAMDRGMAPVFENLDDMPFPEKETYYKRNPSLKLLYTATCSRGCVYRCTYCNSNNLRNIYKNCGQDYFRVRSVDNVIAELKMAKEKYNPWHIMFLDNLFAPQTAWLKEFSQKYKEHINLPFFIETNPNAHTTQTLDLLAEAGCTIVQFGFQSVNEKVRKEILHRGESNSKIIQLISHAKKLGMFVCVDHIANLPGEKEEHYDEAVDFYRELRPDWINLGFLQFYPQADIVQIALANRWITEEELPAIYRGEAQSSFRLLGKSSLGVKQRVLPMRLFAAFKLPRWLSGPALRLIGNEPVAAALSPLSSLFIYFSRIFFAFTDRRDFLVRHHVIRNIFVAKTVLMEKYF